MEVGKNQHQMFWYGLTDEKKYEPKGLERPYFDQDKPRDEDDIKIEDDNLIIDVSKEKIKKYKQMRFVIADVTWHIPYFIGG